MAKLSRSIKAVVVVLLLMLAGVLTACDLFSPTGEGARARISIGSVKTPPGGMTKVKVAVDILTGAGLTVIQVGPSQALRFDPGVVQLKNITGVGGFTVLASVIENTLGEARFAAVNIYGGVTEGEILEIEVEAIGRAGEKSELKLTGVDLLQDEAGGEIAPVKIINGQVEIKSHS